MNYIEIVNELKATPFAEIKLNGQLTMSLIRCYSILYKGGAQVRTCINSLEKYYNEILKNGKMKAEKKVLVDNRTCVPAWEGIKEVYTKEGIEMLNSKYIDDIEARKFLKSGTLKKEDFKTQPISEKELQSKAEAEAKAKAEAEAKAKAEA